LGPAFGHTARRGGRGAKKLLNEGELYLQFALAEILGMTVGELRRRMSSLEFTYWQAYLDLRQRVMEQKSRKPKWSIAQILEWLREAEKLSRSKA